MSIVRILLFWYSDQTVCVKWETCMSNDFCLSNGVRQGGILSRKLFSVYVDDLSDKLIKIIIRCQIDKLCVNYVMYADDSCLIALRDAFLKELIGICYEFCDQNGLSFNLSKSYCMVFKPISYKLSCPILYNYG